MCGGAVAVLCAAGDGRAADDEAGGRVVGLGAGGASGGAGPGGRWRFLRPSGAIRISEDHASTGCARTGFAGVRSTRGYSPLPPPGAKQRARGLPARARGLPARAQRLPAPAQNGSNRLSALITRADPRPPRPGVRSGGG